MIPISKWKWFGNHGHFICGRWCRFHLTTQVGDYLISTIGEYVSPRNSGGSEQAEYRYLTENPLGEDIGHNRKYETMVFKAGLLCKGPRCHDCDQPAPLGDCLDAKNYNHAGDATRGHMEMCLLWAKK